MRLLGSFAGLMLFAAAASAQQDTKVRSSGELALSNDTLQLRYIGDGKALGADNGQFSGAFFLSEQRDIVLSAGLVFPANLDLDRLSFMFGPQAYAALLDDENEDVLTVSVGAEARYVLNKGAGLAVAGHAYYAPDILTFGSADNLTDLGARVEIQIAPRMVAFGGMRWFEFDLTEGGGERTLMDEVFIGFRYLLGS